MRDFFLCQVLLPVFRQILSLFFSPSLGRSLLILTRLAQKGNGGRLEYNARNFSAFRENVGEIPEKKIFTRENKTVYVRKRKEIRT